MGKLCILTDSSCDISFPLSHIDIIKREIHIEGEKEDIKDNYEVDLSFYRKSNIDIPTISYSSYMNTLTDKVKKGYNEFIFVMPSKLINPAEFSLYERVYNDFKDTYMFANTALVDSGLSGVALGLLLYDINELIDKRYSYDEILTYIEENKSKYHMYYYTEDDNKVILDNDDKLKVINAKKAHELVVYQKECDDFSKVVACRKSTYGNYQELFKIFREVNNDLEGSVLIGSPLGSQNQECFEEMIYQEMDYEDILSTTVSKTTGLKVGPRSLFVAYKKK